MTLDERITNIDNRGDIVLAEFDNEFTVLYEKQEKGIVYAALPTCSFDSATVRYLDGSHAYFSDEAREIRHKYVEKIKEKEDQRYKAICDIFKDLIGVEEIPYEKKRNWGKIGLSFITLPLAPITAPIGYAVLTSSERDDRQVSIGEAFSVALIAAPLMFPVYWLYELCNPSTYMNLKGYPLSNKNSGEDLAVYMLGRRGKCSELELLFPNGNRGIVTAGDSQKKEIQADFIYTTNESFNEHALQRYSEATLFLKVDAEKRKNFEQAVQHNKERPKRFAAFEKEMEHFDHNLLLEYAGFRRDKK